MLILNQVELFFFINSSRNAYRAPLAPRAWFQLYLIFLKPLKHGKLFPLGLTRSQYD